MRDDYVAHGKSGGVSEREQTWLKMSEDAVDKLHARVSHGICPDCIRILYPEDADAIIAALG